MKSSIRSALTVGIVAGIIVLLFGGWSVAVVGVMAGLALGYSLSNRLEPTNLSEAVKDTFVPAILGAAVLILISIFQNLIVSPAIGRGSSPFGVMINANIAGFVGFVVSALLMAWIGTFDDRRKRIAQIIVLSLVIAAFPFVDRATNLRWTSQIIFALIFTILALGLNIVVGFAGLLDLGYAAFFAIGAYTTGILASPVHNIQWNFWLVIWIAAAMAAVWGLILGAPTLPLRGDYLAIVTLGFGEIVPVLFRNLIDVTIKEPFTCWILPGLLRLFGSNATMTCITLMEHEDLTLGEKGISPISRPILPIIGQFQSANLVPWYFLIIAIILLSIFLIRRLRDSRLGRAWMAIREDELAAAQMGIDPVATKLLAFSMGATFSGFAGAFYGSYIAGIFPSVFEFSVSIIVLCMVILGGLGNISGVIVGGLVIMGADRLFLPALKDFLGGLLEHTLLPALAGNPTVQAAVAQNADPILYRFLLFGLTLVIMMAVRPEGLLPSAQVRAELHEAASKGPGRGRR